MKIFFTAISNDIQLLSLCDHFSTHSAPHLQPRCYLERLALEIFHHHVPPSPSPNFFYDPETSGAEWWVQLRPSPPGTGRYSMLADTAGDADDDMAKSGISFHWDKDEDLRLLCGGSMYIHPHLSTVTYLTDLGAPTMVISKRVDTMTGKYAQEYNRENMPIAHGECHTVNPTSDFSTSSSVDSSITEGFVSWPKRGKHLSFDGRFLHAAPSDLMEDGSFENQCSFNVSSEMSDKEKKIIQRRHRKFGTCIQICCCCVFSFYPRRDQDKLLTFIYNQFLILHRHRNKAVSPFLSTYGLITSPSMCTHSQIP